MIEEQLEKLDNLITTWNEFDKLFFIFEFTAQTILRMAINEEVKKIESSNKEIISLEEQIKELDFQYYLRKGRFPSE